MKLVQFAGCRGDDPQTDAACQRLHGYAEQGRMGDWVVARINGAGRPCERTEDEGDSADRIDAFGTAEVRGADEQSDACKAEDEADEDARARADAAGTQPIDDHHPEGDSGHEERGDAGGNSRLGPGERSVPAEQQEKAGDDCGAPLRGGGLFFAQVAEERIKNQTDGDVADAGENKGRNRLHSDSNEEIGGTPKDINRGESN